MYATWEPTKNFPHPHLWVYAGKISELVGGLLIALGLFTRVGVLLICMPMIFIAFFIGNGYIWFEDQYPFLFILFGWVFFFLGPGKWSLDNKLNPKL